MAQPWWCCSSILPVWGSLCPPVFPAHTAPVGALRDRRWCHGAGQRGVSCWELPVYPAVPGTRGCEQRACPVPNKPLCEPFCGVCCWAGAVGLASGGEMGLWVLPVGAVAVWLWQGACPDAEIGHCLLQVLVPAQCLEPAGSEHRLGSPISGQRCPTAPPGHHPALGAGAPSCAVSLPASCAPAGSASTSPGRETVTLLGRNFSALPSPPLNPSPAGHRPPAAREGSLD